ncbi:head-tail adaptor [Lentibacter phage vB_LenP_ICBM2]|uniref:Portal protein n=1 Tax=Lentibacter phage vB_LenP_ICBM2 TaxID=2847823 RepID=A0A3G2YRC2_9CAUD|nr:head-tail adaptor [Lentibacter phage vB_LenP_ICBM2]AYP28105.1 portal protein [Lentibacter phage vB_LenP_ICBM2]
MAGTTVDLENIINPHGLAVDIADRFNTWNHARSNKIEEWKELRNYLYATDTRTTSNSKLPWTNSTTTPKLTQIADNLHANYFAALFPQKRWFRFEATDQDSNTKNKRDAIQSYMLNKVRQSDFENTASKLINDYIQYGNCFATVEFVKDYTEFEDGERIVSYVGPRVVRLSPYDVCFNPLAPSFAESPKIVRSVLSLGEIARKIESSSENSYMSEIMEKMVSNRAAMGGNEVDENKTQGFIADGFTSVKEYYESNYVELLTFYGDIYDKESGSFLKNRVITVVDRAYVLSNEQNPSWLGTTPIHHAGWRERPDNLYAMGPLDNLVGMQYRIDHLENLKADVFDQIAYPMIKIRGDVEDFEFAPASRIYMGEEGDVGYLSPDTTALNADFQIQNLENKMEALAGAPREAMGIRSAGEKTAFEVQQLMTAAGRIFQHKTAHFERVFLEPILNDMLEAARRNMDYADTVRVLNEDTGLAFFEQITKEDIKANGKIIPMGARHFAERANRIQSLTQLYQLKLADPSIAAHMSGKEFARILSEELGEPAVFGENISVTEQLETQRMATEAQVEFEEEQQTAIEMGL